MMNEGERTLEWLFEEQLRVDEEWSVKTPYGFRWWADKNAQTVEIVGEESGPDGQVGYYISVRTEVLKSLHLGDDERELLNASLMPFASMAGPVYDETSGVLSLCSLVRVYSQIAEWMNPLISVASVLQIGEARILGPSLAKVLNAEEALSGPPGREMRHEPDEMAEIIDNLIAPLGATPSRWGPEEFEEVVNTYMTQPPVLSAKAEGAAFKVVFPYGDGLSSCEVMADQPHPRYGNGLLVVQSFPLLDGGDSSGPELALSMNKIELAEEPFGYGFGSYVYREGKLHFTFFLPNMAYRPGLLPNIFFSCGQRALEVSQRLTGKG